MQNRRVVITGMGTINPLGDTLEEYYHNLIAGKSGIKRWESIDMTGVECKVGGDLGNYDFQKKLDTFRDIIPESKYKQIKKLFRSATFSSKMAVLCAMDAYNDAGLFGADSNPYDTSVMVAGHNFNSNYIFENAKIYLEDPDFIAPLSGVEAIDPNIPATISEVLEVQGPTFTLGGACASGNLALRAGFRDIVSGECVRSVVAGPPFDVSPPDIQASVIINAVVVKEKYQNNPEGASRPFDTDRCGFVYSHGSGTLILEELESALARGAHIYGEILGVTANANANHLPMPGAANQQQVMEQVLKISGVKPEQIDYVNCHATGTPSGDLQEIKAVKNTFGNHTKSLYLNAPKSMLGHTCWASPLVETIGGLLQMKHGKLHPTINITEQDPEVDLEICANAPVEHSIQYMLKNSFGFGGINCCSLIKRFEV
ncbi:MAG: beta-ketoacyl-[acyl-carrier-protein] synthase family protein [Spirochaetia bacterium]